MISTLRVPCGTDSWTREIGGFGSEGTSLFEGPSAMKRCSIELLSYVKVRAVAQTPAKIAAAKKVRWIASPVSGEAALGRPRGSRYFAPRSSGCVVHANLAVESSESSSSRPGTSHDRTAGSLFSRKPVPKVSMFFTVPPFSGTPRHTPLASWCDSRAVTRYECASCLCRNCRPIERARVNCGCAPILATALDSCPNGPAEPSESPPGA